MKKSKWIPWLLICLLLMGGCKQKTQTVNMDTVFTTTESALTGGHLFFVGKVLGAVKEERLISYYEAHMGKNTFYSVEVTEDYYDCMPDRNIIVCVLGSEETFNREGLKKNKEYIFDTTLWVEGEQTIFLLPTFHTSLPELQGGEVYTMIDGERAHCGSYESYKNRFEDLAAEVNYGPDTVLEAAKALLKRAAERGDPAYFKDLGISYVDEDVLRQTVATAATLAEKAEQTKEDWEGIGELIK